MSHWILDESIVHQTIISYKPNFCHTKIIYFKKRFLFFNAATFIIFSHEFLRYEEFSYYIYSGVIICCK